MTEATADRQTMPIDQQQHATTPAMHSNATGGSMNGTRPGGSYAVMNEATTVIRTFHIPIRSNIPILCATIRLHVVIRPRRRTCARRGPPPPEAARQTARVTPAGPVGPSAQGSVFPPRAAPAVHH